jgi:branched-chain amino acid transport system ATP-binding protein
MTTWAPLDADRGDTAGGLSVRGVTLDFRGVRALDGVSFDVAPGSICGLIGPNGAGKTTLFNCITRLYTPDAGKIAFDDVDLLRLPAHAVIRTGIARTFQNLGLFHGQTVLENLLVSGHSTQRVGMAAAIMRGPRSRRRERENLEEARSALAEVGLESVADVRIENLPFGTQKRVELARALVARPRMLLLDEPANGLAHGEVDELGGLVRDCRDRHGLTVVLVEHHMKFVMELCDHIVALNSGAVIFDGSPEESRRSAALAEAYLGVGS